MKAPRKQRLRKVYILPNLFTAFNLFLGVVAIYHVYLAQSAPESGHLVKACWYIILAGVLDGLDGAVARITHTESDFGMQFDSLCDMVSFGVSPSVVAFHMLSIMHGGNSRFIVTVCALFAICGALRLARYNVQSGTSEHSGFLGLPIPCAAGGLVIFVLTIHDYGLLTSNAAFNGLPVRAITSALFPFLVVLLALLMVSEIPYASLAKQIRLKRQMSFQTLRSIVFIIAVVWGLRQDARVLLVLLGGFTYIFFFPLAALWQNIRSKTTPVAATAETAPPSEDKA